ncbi:membrane-bound lytic murein transglycosylase B [Faunimonas pinastri]|uniref:Membrane-bound lytic murein transglycosylase B n=1 Tax=Faunimonas pinastri TaxID=1855383 RepID=A0A1H9P4W4_9HYPH|nr:lytic murein transglycosylase [Faunimonas pinastri]SER42869.1 membrane-bound lytic murein transglycosylase B [Faunimonas pinastri]
MRRLLSLPSLALVLAATCFSSIAHADAGFDRWVAGFWPTAAQAGISRAVYQAAFRGVSPDPDVLERAHYQPEFVKPLWDYVEGAVSDKRIATGRVALQQYRTALDAIERRYGVPREILVAIWGIESSYGEALQDPKRVKPVVRSLATLAYADPRRAKFGRTQLIATLKILQHGDISPKGLTGSWAGAMGHTQFIPTTYNGYAVDFDGDGRRDIWNSPVDAMASAANYLKKAGWNSGKTWGYEVLLPPELSGGRKGSLPISQWARAGVVRVGGKDFPRGDDKAVLVLPAGQGGPAFLMLRNHFVIKRYNQSTAYALAVGHLADRLIGAGPFVHAWPNGQRALKPGEVQEVQQRLSALGYYDGEIDGKAGPASREAVKAFQSRNGMEPNGHAGVEVLSALREG